MAASFVKTNDEASLKVFPNPIKQHLNIEFEMSHAGNLQIDLFDINGKKVASLLDGFKSNGKHQLQKTFAPNEFSKGIYFVVMQNKNGIIGRTKVVLM